MGDPGSSIAQSLNGTLNGTLTNAPKEKAVYLLHSNVKIFTNAIAALSKLGDEIFLQAQERGLRLKAFNKNRSAYGVFLFMDDFFTDFDTKFVKGGVRDCRISTKTALTIFKSAHFIEKNLVSCTLTIDCLGQGLHIDFQHTYDISRSFEVNVMEIHKPFTSNITREDLSNSVTVGAAEITSFLTEMHSGREELIMRALEDKFVFKNYLPCEDDTIEGTTCRTEITVAKSCFKSFSVQKPSEISFGMKEFKAIITFARQHFCDVSLFFDKAGSPLIVGVESDAGFSAEFIIATLDGEDDADEEAAPATTQEPVAGPSHVSQSVSSQKSQESVQGSQSRRRRIKKPRLSNEGTSFQPTQPRQDLEPNVSRGNNEEVQRNSSEESAEMPPTQPSRNPLGNELATESDEQNMDRLSLDEDFSSSPEAMGDVMPIEEFGLEPSHHEETETMQQAEIAAPAPKMNVEVGIDLYLVTGVKYLFVYIGYGEGVKYLSSMQRVHQMQMFDLEARYGNPG
ncbi:unnamed protein product [Cylicocyclus nassatus]|uniref:Cell cycle checkpoint control protein n=1 Tax=Cylicocyclus nassatus TaxID=53992 RepID=A0AA36GSM3_CYLNA|nr:unnamed protein product [Cylicocyclus nassatus]